MEIELTIKNYRCFPDSTPARIVLRKGFTSFVGLNNSGKSSLLKCFYEFRNLFGLLSPTSGNFHNALRGHAEHFNPSVLDPDEVFSNVNDREIKIDIKPIIDDAEKKLFRLPVPEIITITYSREPKHWVAELYVGGEKIWADNLNFLNNVLRLGGNERVVLTPLTEMTRIFNQVFYVPAFRNVLNIGTHENYYDIQVGQSLIQFWDNLKNGSGKKGNEYAIRISEDLRKLFGYDSLEINPQPGNERLQLVANKKTVRMDEVGSGLAQFFIVLANAANKNPSYILIDEPELNLHPALQLDFLTTLASYSTEGLLYATHSLGLARSNSERIYSVRRIAEGISEVKEYEATPNLAEFVGSLSFSSYQELGFERILLVEGVSDVKTIQQFLRQYYKEHKIVLLPLGGNSLIDPKREVELQEIKRISPQVSALIDSERGSKNESLSNKRQEFVKICEKAKIKCKVLDRRATENYFSDRAVKKVKNSNAYRALDPYESLTDVSPRWSKEENWRIAREMTREELDETDLGEFLSKL